MKKGIKIVVTMLMLFILTGCMNLDVKSGITKDHTAYLEYTIKMDIKDLDYDSKAEVKDYIDDIVKEYEDYGFEVTKDNDTDYKIETTLSYKKTASNYEDAYKNLQDILNDPKISFLLSTDMSTSAEDYEQAFMFKGDTDVAKILNTTNFNTFPLNIRNQINQGLEKSKINFSLTLPESKIVETTGKATNKDGSTTITFPVSVTEATNFNVIARSAIEDNKATGGDAKTAIEENKDTVSLYKTLIPIIGIVALGLIGLLVYLILKQKKNKDNIEDIPEDKVIAPIVTHEEILTNNELIAEDDVSEEPLNDEVINETVIIDDVINEDAVIPEVTSEEVTVDEPAKDEVVIEETIPDNVINEVAETPEVISEEVAIDEPINNEVVIEETIEVIPVDNASVTNPSNDNTAIEDPSDSNLSENTDEEGNSNNKNE